MRAVAAAPIALFAFVCALALAALAAGAGLVPDDALALWAAAVTAGDRELSIGSIIATYPSIPFISTTLLQLVTPAGTPSAALLAAGLFGLMTGIWFRALRMAEVPAAFAILATLLLALHPMFLRAAIAGPAEMFLAFFLYLFGNALYDLRARTNIPEVMMAGTALLGVAFSHPIGAAIAAGAAPFLAFAVRPIFVAGSAVSIVLVLVFPALFGIAAFAYLSWVFPGHGWRFFASQESAAEWIGRLGSLIPGGFPGVPVLNEGLTIAAALILAAPLAVVVVGWVHRRRPLVAPAAIFAATAVVAGMLTVATGLFGDPVTVTVAAPLLAAIVLIRVPIARYRRPIVILLLTAGIFGGGLALTLLDPRAAAQLDVALQGRIDDQEHIDTLTLGGATIGHNGVLVDSFNAPSVVLGRGRSSGLLLPSSEPFAIAMLLSRIEAPFVAVPNPRSSVGARDRLNKAFPLLYRDGLLGYRLVYQNNTWRLFARQSAEVVYTN